MAPDVLDAHVDEGYRAPDQVGTDYTEVLVHSTCLCHTDKVARDIPVVPADRDVLAQVRQPPMLVTDVSANRPDRLGEDVSGRGSLHGGGAEGSDGAGSRRGGRKRCVCPLYPG